jgi:hypothetical protein
MAASVTDEELHYRAAVRHYHELQESANAAALGSATYRRTWTEIHQLHAELEALGIDPNQSWRQHVKRRLGIPVPPEQPGEKERRRRPRALAP